MTNIASECRSANIVRDHAMILPDDATPKPDAIFGKDRSWLRRQTESPGVFRTRGSPWSLSMALFGGDLVWGYGISATDCLAIRSEKPFLHFRGFPKPPIHQLSCRDSH